MKSHFPASLAIIVLAGTLVSCSVGNNDNVSDQNDQKMNAQSTSGASPVVPPSTSSEPSASSDMEPVEASPESDGKSTPPDVPVTPAVPVTSEKLELPSDTELGEVKDGPTKNYMEYVAEKLKAHIATHGKPKTDNWLEAIASDTPELNDATSIGFSLSDDDTWTLHGWNPNDPTYKDSSTALEYHSLEGFIAL